MNRFKLVFNLLKLPSTCSNLKQLRFVNNSLNNILYSSNNNKSKNVPNDQIKIQ